MFRSPSPYDVIGAIGFVQGSLTLVAAVVGAIWSVTQQARSNHILAINLNHTVVQLKEQYEGYTFLSSGMTQDLINRIKVIDNDLSALIRVPRPKCWLKQGEHAIELMKISSQLDSIQLEFHLIKIRNQIIQEITGTLLPASERSYPSGGRGDRLTSSAALS